MALPPCTFESGHLAEAVVHCNEALRRVDAGEPATAVAEVLFRCLNKLQSALPQAVEGAEVARFIELVRLAAHADRSPSRLLGPELRALAALRPQVMDHNVLRRGDYRPGSRISPDLLREATAKHRKLANALERLDTEASAAAMGQVVKRCAELLYVVRSNIAHGEKTPYGPDPNKRQRDEAVCQPVIPLCLLLVDLLLDQPSRRLVTYGTLAPGEPNHSVVESIGGRWLPCAVEASLTEVRGLPVLSWRPGAPAPPIRATLLESDDLPGHWDRLDAFEGDMYRRQLIPVSMSGQGGTCIVVVANAYLGAVGSQG